MFTMKALPHRYIVINLLGLALLTTACSFLPFGQLKIADPRLVTLPPSQRDQIQLRDDRPLITEIRDVTLEPSATGAIIIATGSAAIPGHYDADLVFQGFQDGILTLDFRAALHKTSRVQRPISAATTISSERLKLLRTVIIHSDTKTLYLSR